MRRRRSQLTIAAVTFLLGVLVVIQLRTQASGAAFAGLSSQDLTVLVANLDDRNDQLRTEVATLESELNVLSQNTARGDVSVDELRADLRRVRLYAGIDPAMGPGVSVTVRGTLSKEGPFTPDRVAEALWSAAHQDESDWQTEVPYEG